MIRPLPHRLPRSPRARRRATLAAATALGTALALVPAAGAPAATFLGDPVIGPSPAVQSLGGLSLAPDGTGALVATVQDGGVDHVYVSRLANGAWGAPERVDGGLGGPSSQPVVAAADGGRVAVAFVNGGNLYAVTRTSAGAGWGARQTVWGSGGAANPSLSLSVNRKGYLAFTAAGNGGHDVRAAFSRDGGPWALVNGTLDANGAADAGTGANRPKVGAAADGVGIVVWGEAGHVYARRLQGTRVSTVVADALAGLVVEGVQASGADSPVVGVEDDDSWTGVAMRATFVVDGAPRERVVFRRLRGSKFEGPATVDSAPFASGQGSATPQIATGGTGLGIVTGTNDATQLTSAMLLRANAAPGPIQQVDSVAPSTAAPYAVPAIGTPLKMLVAWQLTPGGGQPEIRARFYDGTAFQPEEVFSRPELGPANAANGLAAAGDDNGDLVVAYAQDVPGQGRAIAAAAIDQAPGRFAAHRGPTWQRTTQPLLTWTRSRESWGLYFKVTVDGQDAGNGDVANLRKRLAAPLSQGVHSWQVTAYDRRGQSYAAPPSIVRIDSIGPTAVMKLTGTRRTGTVLRLTVAASDAAPLPAPGQTAAQTSGVKEVFVDWGDGKRERIVRGTRHAYVKARRYTLRVVVSDNAGNRTTVRQTVRIVKPRKQKKSAGKASRAARAA